MDSRKKKLTIVALICLVLAGAITLSRFFGRAITRSALQIDSDEQVWIKCTECGATYAMPMREYFDVLQSQGNLAADAGSMPAIECRECRKQAAYSAIKCPECNEVFFRGALGPREYPDKCPNCGYSEIAESQGAQE
jgi:hypothetical protein